MRPYPGYFAACKTREGVKEEYHRLCRLHYPDYFSHELADVQSRQTRIMQAINAAYAMAMDTAIRAEKPRRAEASYSSSADVAERIRQPIAAVSCFGNIVVEISGNWIFLHGDTYPLRTHLTEHGCGTALSFSHACLANSQRHNRRKGNGRVDFQVCAPAFA